MRIDGERAYPIYRVDAKWEQDIAEGDDYSKYPKWTEGLPDGRFYNSAGRNMAYRDDPGTKEVKQWAIEEWWPKLVKEKDYADKNMGEPEITVKGPRYETWILTWFEHYTFDDGRGDKEYLKSFRRYVRRYEHMQHDSTEAIKRYGDDYVCLMGAEDEWRWHGAGETGGRDERSDAPCRCEHCQEQGLVRIGH